MIAVACNRLDPTPIETALAALDNATALNVRDHRLQQDRGMKKASRCWHGRITIDVTVRRGKWLRRRSQLP
uniref:Transposase n=1 Tax=Mesocestoides corti TaxID=53468 RepID=A0A5K3G6J3_MESCO